MTLYQFSFRFAFTSFLFFCSYLQTGFVSAQEPGPAFEVHLTDGRSARLQGGLPAYRVHRLTVILPGGDKQVVSNEDIREIWQDSQQVYARKWARGESVLFRHLASGPNDLWATKDEQNKLQYYVEREGTLYLVNQILFFDWAKQFWSACDLMQEQNRYKQFRQDLLLATLQRYARQCANSTITEIVIKKWQQPARFGVHLLAFHSWLKFNRDFVYSQISMTHSSVGGGAYVAVPIAHAWFFRIEANIVYNQFVGATLLRKAGVEETSLQLPLIFMHEIPASEKVTPALLIGPVTGFTLFEESLELTGSNRRLGSFSFTKSIIGVLLGAQVSTKIAGLQVNNGLRYTIAFRGIDSARNTTVTTTLHSLQYSLGVTF